MVKNHKKYFSFYCILISSSNRVLHSYFCKIKNLLSFYTPKILDILMHGQLKPIKTYSTNKIKN